MQEGGGARSFRSVFLPAALPHAWRRGPREVLTLMETTVTQAARSLFCYGPRMAGRVSCIKISTGLGFTVRGASCRCSKGQRVGALK